MNTKNIPAIMSLSAGALTSIVTFLLRYEIRTMLGILLLVLFLFYIAGLLVKYVLDKFQAEIAEREAEEERLRKQEEEQAGAVMEKEMTEEENKYASEIPMPEAK